MELWTGFANGAFGVLILGFGGRSRRHRRFVVAQIGTAGDCDGAPLIRDA